MHLQLELQSIDSVATRPPYGNSKNTALAVDATLTESQAIELLHELAYRLDVSHFERVLAEKKGSEK